MPTPKIVSSAHLDDQGIELKWWRFRTQPEKLIQHVQAIPATDKRLMLEETNLARWISELLKSPRPANRRL